MRDHHIQPAIAVVIEECATGSPALPGGRESRRVRDVVKPPSPVVTVQSIRPVVSDQQVVVAVVVVITDAGALSPAASDKSSGLSDILETQVA